MQLINLVYLERRTVDTFFGANSIGGESSLVDYKTRARQCGPPWGRFRSTWIRKTAPEGFSGAINSMDEGQYAPFSGLYEGEGPQSEQVILAVAATGHVIGYLRSEEVTVGVSMQFRDLAYRVEAAENQTAFRSLELSWNEEQDAAVLVMVDDQGGARSTREEPVAPYETCRNGLQCRLAGDRRMLSGGGAEFWCL